MGSWENFTDSIKSDYTRFDYTRKLKFFLAFVKCDAEEFVERSKESKVYVEKQILDFVRVERGRVNAREISASHLRNMLKPVRLLLDMNDVNLNWRKLNKFVPAARRFAHDSAPTVGEIRKIIEHADKRVACVILLMASGGIRIGAFDWLRVGDIQPIHRNGKLLAASLRVYRGEEEEYLTYIAPECQKQIEGYMEFRRRFGEKITPESPLMRDKFLVLDKEDANAAGNPVRLKATGVKRLIENALWTQGLRTEMKKRHEFAADHGFRKFFKTRAEQVTKPINVETMMGHSTGISDSYYRPTEEDLLDDYLKAVPLLTVSETEEIRQESLAVEQKNAERLRQLEELVSQLVAEKGQQVLALGFEPRRARLP